AAVAEAGEDGGGGLAGPAGGEEDAELVLGGLEDAEPAIRRRVEEADVLHAPAHAASCPARRKRPAASSQPLVNTAVAPMTSTGQAGPSAPMFPARAMRPTATWTAAVANMALAMPLARKAATAEPTTADSSTPANIRLAGLSSLPMMPTAPVAQTSRKAVP